MNWLKNAPFVVWGEQGQTPTRSRRLPYKLLRVVFMGIKDKLMIYIYRKKCQLEDEDKTLKRSLQLSALDNLDHYEILLQRIRIQAWNEFVEDLYRIVLNCD